LVLLREMLVEAVKAVVPFSLLTSQPVVHWEEAFNVKSRGAPLALTASMHETCLLQHLEMLRDGGLSEGRALAEFEDAGFTSGEALENRSARGVRESAEDLANRVESTHYLEDI
jgi:hypothetical protein